METKNEYKPIMINSVQTRLHRVVWEQHHGKIPKGAVIHHKDGDKSNNDIDNLELVKSNGIHLRKYHSSFPYSDIKPRALSDYEYNFIKDRLPLKQLGLLRDKDNT